MSLQLPMPRFLLFTLTALLAACFWPMPRSSAEDRTDEVEAAHRRWVAALNAGDVDTIRRHSLPEISMFPAQGRLMKDFDDRRWEAIERSRSERAEERHVEHDIEEVKIYGDVAILTGHSRLHITHPDGTREELARRLTYIWVRQDDEWRQTHHHVSPLTVRE
jgi:ketosteroid isomerase-like protein